MFLKFTIRIVLLFSAGSIPAILAIFFTILDSTKQYLLLQYFTIPNNTLKTRCKAILFGIDNTVRRCYFAVTYFALFWGLVTYFALQILRALWKSAHGSLPFRLLAYFSLLFPSSGGFQLSGSGLRSSLALLVAELWTFKVFDSFFFWSCGKANNWMTLNHGPIGSFQGGHWLIWSCCKVAKVAGHHPERWL